MYSIYVCDDFHYENKVLTIYQSTEVAQIETFEQYSIVYTILMSQSPIPNAIICPELFKQKNDFNIILFENN
jgi:hypothetical protein